MEEIKNITKFNPIDVRQQDSILGPEWVSIYLQNNVSFESNHYEQAMNNVIMLPNINSTIILRSDILKKEEYELSNEDDNGDRKWILNDEFISDLANQVPDIEEHNTNNDSNSNTNTNENENENSNKMVSLYLSDQQYRSIPISSTLNLHNKLRLIRRMIPRNPFKDAIINQTCLLLSSNELKQEERSILIAYIPHIQNESECPFYLPPVQCVALLLHNKSISVHYLPFNYSNPNSLSQIKDQSDKNRLIRISYHLLKTSYKHSNGVKLGYSKRVHHDLIISKSKFQDRYIKLKQKYASQLVKNWVESTDPSKHVFEDLSIAAFLIEIWNSLYINKNEFIFRDLGCGNGLLVYLLIMEGYNGIGIDARKRKSWNIYPKIVQDCLKEQFIIPGILLKNQQQKNQKMYKINNEFKTSTDLINDKNINTCNFPKNTFLIGNHSDELTLWIPLLGYPFFLIPCCSHSLNGEKFRFSSSKTTKSNKNQNQNDIQIKENDEFNSSSKYGALVKHTIDISKKLGWKINKEMLRIPSTRNAAIIGARKVDASKEKLMTVYEVLEMEGGADGYIEHTMGLKPSNH